LTAGDASVRNPAVRNLIRNFAIEVVIYGALVVVYFFLVLRFLAEPLANLFETNLVVYAFIGLGLIVAQGALLEFITSFLLSRLGLERLK
jgi:hypothetical protein